MAAVNAQDRLGHFEITRQAEAIVCSGGATRLPETLASLEPALTRSMYIVNPHGNDGLTILLNGTPALDGSPAAKAAFVRAAQAWEAIISTPITVIIDVDYGPTFFGIPYPNGSILGSTNAAAGLQPYVRVGVALNALANHALDKDLASKLPFPSLPTDAGNASIVYVTQANLRALGLLPANASNLEPHPQIGFNSSHAFDFDRSDGVTTGFDFEAIAAHEIGHVLGFSSTVGINELSPGTPSIASVLDLYRLRPGASLGTFSTSQRIQSAGGDHEFFALDWSAPLSTGRGDGTGGDGEQASHWKDDRFINWNVGLMDPRLPPFRYATATVYDAFAFDLLGYAIRYPDPPQAPSNLSAVALNASEIRLTWRDNAINEADFRIDRHDGSQWTEIGAVGPNTTEFRSGGLLPGTTYRYRVLASNSGGFSHLSNEAVTPTPSSCVAPVISLHPVSTAAVASSVATLSVTASGTSPLTYQWYQGVSGSGTPISGATSALYTSPPLISTSQFWVRVSNSCGAANSNTATIVVAAPQVPSPPFSLTYSDRVSDEVIVWWQHDGANVKGFKFYYSFTGTGFINIGTGDADWRGVVFSQLSPDYAYYFRVTAYNDTGESIAATIYVPTFNPPKRRGVRH